MYALLTQDHNQSSQSLMQYCHKEHTLGVGRIKEPLQRHFVYMSSYCSLIEGELDGNIVIVKAWRGLSMNMCAWKGFTKRVSKELNTWMSVSSHRNVASVIGMAPGFERVPALVMPKYQNGNILEYLKKNEHASATHLLCGVSNALNFMHSRTPPVVHGKIRASNILIADTGEACLTDIGMGSIFLPQELEFTTDEIKDARWMPPEVIQAEEESLLQCTADVYRFGMTMLEVYSGRVPYAHIRNPALVIHAVMNRVRPSREACVAVSNATWSLMEHCWAHEASSRPSMNLVMDWLESLSRMEMAKRMLSLSSISLSVSAYKYEAIAV